MTENKSKNILEMLEQHVISLPDRQAVIYEPGERITYRELWMLSGRKSTAILARSCSKALLQKVA